MEKARAILAAISVLMSGAVLTSSNSAHADGLSNAKAGIEALEAGEYAKAVTLFSRAITKGKLGHDDLELAYIKRAQAYLGQKKNALALVDLGYAEALAPHDKDISALRLRAIGDDTGEPTSQLGDPNESARVGLAAINAGAYEKGVALLTRAIDSHALSRADLELAYVKRAEAYMALGKYDGARSDLSQALAIDPDDAEVQLIGREVERRENP